ncbi:MAG: type II toxin-antitoxin system HipA family toxin [Deltaproteobacteria bacterium]|nr:MAG: type II toxin-antitoxin system HipA family toxin [Deltaproteobacteria bacterium]
MRTVSEVRLWGRTIGAVSLGDGTEVASFEYDPAFVRSGIEIAPLTMPLARKVYSFSALGRDAFHGLPGLLADSLPDKFGNALINAWLATQGRSPDSFNAVERLCYTGTRGMGALEYAPAIGPKARQATHIEVDKLVELVSEVLTHRNNLQAAFGDDGSREDALRDILHVGTSAGGARAKAVIAWNPKTNEVRSGQVKADPGFEHWLLKFDGVSGNKDKELEDPKGYGVIEHAYYQMADDAHITMNECRLLEENGRRHFMTRRFDRQDGGEKKHMQSLGAMAHFDYNLPGAHSYEQALLVIRQLGLPMTTIEEQFRRMVFNIIARNQDDHVKNIAFLMDRTGQWSLAPAFDMTYSFQPTGKWTPNHQMSLNGKRDDFTREDFRTCAEAASMKRGRADEIFEEVRSVVSRWREYAEENRVDVTWREKIAKTLRLDRFS